MMDYVAIAKLAMALLGNKGLLDKVKDMIPTPPPSRSDYKQGSVAWLQDSLNSLMGSELEVDGELGPLTIAEVKDYQRSVDGLEADGLAGPLTMAAIVHDLESS